MRNSKFLIAIFAIVIIIEVSCVIILTTHKGVDEGRILSPSSRNYITPKDELAVSNPVEFMRLDTQDIAKSDIMHISNQYITKVFPKLYSLDNFTRDDFQEMYNENDYELENCGLNNYEKLNNIFNKIKEKEINFGNYKSIQFNNAKSENEKLTVYTFVTYDNDKIIRFNLTFINGMIEKVEVL